MEENLKFTETDSRLTIEIIPVIKPIEKVVFIVKSLFYVGIGVGLMAVLIFQMSDLGLILVGFFAILAVYILIGRTYFNNTFYKEIIEVTKDDILVIDQYPFSKKIKTFPIAEISHIGFVGQRKYTQHPLDGNAIDFNGFATMEKEMQYLIKDGTIEIFYNGAGRRFGKNLPSWDAEEIIKRITAFTGNNLNMDDKMEQMFEELNTKIEQ
ncbi:MAG: hypothetical protein V4620_00270 [Bacteroidota bacterium]